MGLIQQLPSQVENADQTMLVLLPEMMLVDIEVVCCQVNLLC
jgi:hypothetical protein